MHIILYRSLQPYTPSVVTMTDGQLTAANYADLAMKRYKLVVYTNSKAKFTFTLQYRDTSRSIQFTIYFPRAT